VERVVESPETKLRMEAEAPKRSAPHPLSMVCGSRPIRNRSSLTQTNCLRFQEVSLGTLTSSATPGTEVDGVFYHYMGQLDGYSQLAAVFDQYRFLQVSIAFLPRCMATATTGTVYPTFVGHLITAIDYDDAATTSAGLLRQKETANITLTTEQQTRTYTPHAALAAYSGTFTSYSNMTRMWIDSASPNVQHYSCKVALLDCGFASAVLYDVYARYVVQFRQVQ